MRFLGIVTLIVVLHSRMVLLTDFSTTPKFVPRGHTRPADMKNCRLHIKSLYPWIVGVWDTAYYNYVGIGSMITYISFITTCRQYNAPFTAYKAVAQFIWNMSHPDEPCMQEKPMQALFKHPSCVKSPKDATFFDFAVFKLARPFDISGRAYPTATIPTTPIELMSLIANVDREADTVDCTLPRFRNQNEKPPRFEWKTFVQAVPFHQKCVALLCEKNPMDLQFSKMCTKRLGERLKTTMLCMRNLKEENIVLGVNHAYWYAGTPLNCNGTAYGLAAQAKIRRDFTTSPKYDIHFIVTFIRCWPWLNQQISQNSPKWEENNEMKEFTRKPLNLPSPYTPYPPTVPYYFYEWQEKRSDANSLVPTLKYIVTPMFITAVLNAILHCCY